MIHDGILNIAIGRNRKETSWKNTEMLWSQLAEKLSATHRTAETVREYASAKKLRQDEIKDIGGFVGGYVSGGRRKTENILNRQVVALDIDFGTLDLWDLFVMIYGNAAVLYSTHKHTPETPRLRLIIPLDRPVARDEYAAISRYIAGDLGINAFDDSTFEPARLMYWPSTPKDGEYIYRFNDGPWLSADKVLNSYTDWTDTTQWPVSDRVDKTVLRDMKKQGDPLEKPGLIGAFCRQYDIHEAIEAFLSDVYEPCVNGRYTYKEGSTSAGLVTYEDKFAFSHHGTDPVSGKLCNAFDLVRLHKFGILDEDAKEGTAPNRLPSYTTMIDFVSQIPEVRLRVSNERLADAREDFADEFEPAEEDNEEWKSGLDIDSKGNIRSTIANILLVLRNDIRLKGRIGLNKFGHREVMKASLPWRKYDKSDAWLKDADDAGMRYYLENMYGITGKQKIDDAVKLVVEENSFHPVKDYLKSLKWDGHGRAERLFIDYLGAPDTEYTRTVTKKLLTGAVARVYSPGCKFDYIVVLVGPQGVGKSSLIKKLGGDWFSDTLGDLKSKDAFEQLQGVWIMELAELSSLKKAEQETVKHFVSKQEDRFRVAYGRRTENFPRQCVFFGTTNRKDFLHDPTGDRRFWPIGTMEQTPKYKWQDITQEDIDQIWAEAIELYRAGERLYLDEQLEKEARVQQDKYSEQNEKAGIIHEYLNTLLPENWTEMDIYARRAFLQGDDLSAKGIVQRDKVCIPEIYCELFGGSKKELTPYVAREYHDIMRKMEGWEEYKGGDQGRLRFAAGYGRQKAYVRVETVSP